LTTLFQEVQDGLSHSFRLDSVWVKHFGPGKFAGLAFPAPQQLNDKATINPRHIKLSIRKSNNNRRRLRKKKK
jgi:hypothetical protein